MPAPPARERPWLFRAPLNSRLALDAALRCLHDTDHPFALTGAWAGGGALLGCSPLRVAAEHEDPFAIMAGVPGGQNSPVFVGGGWVGYLGYQLRASIERGDPPPPAAHPLPAFSLAYYDHIARRDSEGAWWFEALWSQERAGELESCRAWWMRRLADPPGERPAATNGWRSTPLPAGHAELVAACRERIAGGDLFQANICAELEGRLEGSALELFIRGVSKLAPDRAAYLGAPWGAIASLSPELFLERRGRRVRTAPIKGTRPRHDEPRRAAAERRALEGSEKDRAENVMIVDLMRNDLGRVCEPGTIVAGPLLEVRAHAGVWHLVSEVAGDLRDEVDDRELLRATFPPGSVTGAPKIAAMNVIAELESHGRQVYTGAIGFASPCAGLELSVAIRTFEVTDTTVRLGVGGGVVADSDPGEEAAELAVKAAPLLTAIGATIAPREGRPPGPRVRRLGPVPVPRPEPRRGVFETMLVRRGRVTGLAAHLGRLRASVASLYGAELPGSAATDIVAAAETLAPVARLRVDAVPGIGGEGLEISIEARPLPPAGPVALVVWTIPGGLGAHKWVDRRLIDTLEAASPGAQPLFVDADGVVLETSRASVFALRDDGVLRTPADDGRILPGTARARVLCVAPSLGLEIEPSPLRLDDLLAARSVILTSALRCLPAASLDGQALRSEEEVLGLLGRALGAGPGPSEA